MRNEKIHYLFFFAVLVTITAANHPTFSMGAQYTAKATIRVLPYADKDPLKVETPPINAEVQKRFQKMMAKLITQQSTLRELLMRDRIRETEWFRNFGRTGSVLPEEIDIEKGIQSSLRDLNQNLKATVETDSDLIIISMTGSSKEEAALIANEAADLFVRKRGEQEAGIIRDKIKVIRESKMSLQNELTNIQNNLDNLRVKSGFTDLSEENFPHPARVRLNRLQRTYDDCILEIEQLKAEVQILKKETRKDSDTKELHNAQRKLEIQQNRLEQLHRMLDEAETVKKQFDLAKIHYENLITQLKEKEQLLQKVDLQIQRLTLMINDPTTAKVQIVEQASIPLEADELPKVPEN